MYLVNLETKESIKVAQYKAGNGWVSIPGAFLKLEAHFEIEKLRDGEIAYPVELGATDWVVSYAQPSTYGLQMVPHTPEYVAQVTKARTTLPALQVNSDAGRVCAEVYQLLGSLMQISHMIPNYDQWMDNLANARIVHEGLLPIELPLTGKCVECGGFEYDLPLGVHPALPEVKEDEDAT